MIRLLLRGVVFLGSAALGLWVASLLLDGVTVQWSGYLVAVLIFAVAQSVLAPWVFKMTRRYAPAFLGGIGLVSTFVALLLAHLLTDGLRISGAVTWVLATLVVWLVTALGTLLLPLVLLKKATGENGPAARR